MPPLPVVPQVMKVIVHGTYHDTAWLNIWYIHYTGAAPSSANIVSYLTTVWGAIAGNYADEMTVDNEITSLEGIDLTSDTSASGTYTSSIFGVRTGDFNPASVAMVCSLEINRRYRGGHPRKYLPWGTAGTFASGSTKDWDPGFVADCQTKIDNLLANVVGISEGSTTWDQVVNVSYRSGKAIRATAVVDPVTSAVIRSRICTQRRRLGKVGG